MSVKNRRTIKRQEELPTLDMLQAGLFYLLNQYTFRQCPAIAEKIVEHIDMLCAHPHIDLLPSQRHLYSRMANIWRARRLTAARVQESETVH